MARLGRGQPAPPFQFGALAAGGAQYTQAVTGSLSTAGALARRAAKIFTATASSSGVLAKRTQRGVTGGLTTAGALVSVKIALLSIAGTLASTGLLANRSGKVYVGSLASAGALTKRTQLAFSGAITSAGVLSTVKAALLSIAGTLSIAGLLTKQGGKSLSGDAASAGLLSKQSTRALTAVLESVGSIIASRTALIALVGAVTFSRSLSRLVSKGLEGELGFVGSFVKRISITLAGTLASAGAVSTPNYPVGIPDSRIIRLPAGGVWVIDPDVPAWCEVDWLGVIADGVTLSSVAYTLPSAITADDTSIDADLGKWAIHVDGTTHAGTHQIQLTATLSNAETISLIAPLRVFNE